MIGMDLDIPHKDVEPQLIYQEHCFTGCAGTNILRLLPPLCLTKADVDQFIEASQNCTNDTLIQKIDYFLSELEPWVVPP